MPRLRSGWIPFVLMLAFLLPLSGVAAQRNEDRVDLVLVADRSGSAPDPDLRQGMADLLLLWMATASPSDRLMLIRAGLSPRLLGGPFRMGDPEERNGMQRLLSRLGGFDGKEILWDRAMDLAIRGLGRLPDPAPYTGILAIARRSPQAPEALARAAALLAGPPTHPFFGLSLEEATGRLDQTLGRASGGAVMTASPDAGGYEAALQLWAALSPHRWVTWMDLPPGLEQTLNLPPGATWAAFVLIRPSPSVRLVNLIHDGKEWLGPAARPDINSVSTDRMEIVTLLRSGSYEGEWRIRSEGIQTARLGVIVSLQKPLQMEVPGPARRLVVPADAPLYLEVTAPQGYPEASLEWAAGDLRVPLRDDGENDREAGDGRAGGLLPSDALAGGGRGSLRLLWKGGSWEQPVWLDPLPGLPVLEARVPISPTPGAPITLVVNRPAEVEEVRWRWVGWRLGMSRYQPPETATSTENGWEWTFRVPTGGTVRFLALAEVQTRGPEGSLVYPQAVVAEFPVVAPTESRLFLALEKPPPRLRLPGEITLVITSTLDRPAQLRLEVVGGEGRAQVYPAVVYVPAREVIRQRIQVRGEGLVDSQTIRIRAREEKGAPVEGGELSLTVVSGGGSGLSPAWFCLGVAAGIGAFIALRILSRRSRERWLWPG